MVQSLQGHRIVNPSKKERGRWAETQAARYLEQRGWRICGRNFKVPLFSSRGVEIDLLAQKGSRLLLVEVKFRQSSDAFRSSWDWVSERQLRRLKSALYYAAAKFPELSPSLLILWVDERGLVHFLENP